MARGRLRIYLGAAPGVGKTHAMLQEGQRLAQAGSDVVVGFVEPHGRRPTAALAAGLEMLSRRTMEYRGAYSHGRLAAHDAESGLRAEAEHTRASLLLTASRDLRGPLSTADEALSSMGAGTDPEETRLLAAARSSVGRAVQLLSNLDELSRLHAGALDLYLRPVALDEVLTAVLDALGPGGHTIQCRLPEQLPDVIADAAVLTRVLTASAAEAQRYSPLDRAPQLTAEVRAGQVEIHMEDGADETVLGAERGTHPSRRPDSLTLRMCRDLMESMGGALEAASAGPGFAVTLTLPAAAPPAAGQCRPEALKTVRAVSRSMRSANSPRAVTPYRRVPRWIDVRVSVSRRCHIAGLRIRTVGSISARFPAVSWRTSRWATPSDHFTETRESVRIVCSASSPRALRRPGPTETLAGSRITKTRTARPVHRAPRVASSRPTPASRTSRADHRSDAIPMAERRSPAQWMSRARGPGGSEAVVSAPVADCVKRRSMEVTLGPVRARVPDPDALLM